MSFFALFERMSAASVEVGHLVGGLSGGTAGIHMKQSILPIDIGL